MSETFGLNQVPRINTTPYDQLQFTQSLVDSLLTGARCPHLAKQLPYHAIVFNLYTNNYYTTLDLLLNLHSIGIGECGTMQKK